MSNFVQSNPTLDSYWRSIILFGRNSATYKFALAKCLLSVADQGITSISLEEIAKPYALTIVEHLRLADKQITSLSSSFLEICRQYRDGQTSIDKLCNETIRLGFNNVIDAFHIVNLAEIPIHFFIDERRTTKSITITDELLRLKEQFQFKNLPHEVEARWRLVETAWSLNLAPKLLSINHDFESDELYVVLDKNRRVQVTSSRQALNGYQKGKCFYCDADISIKEGTINLADVDHFFPHVTKNLSDLPNINFDGIWNLVLSCQACNRGPLGKFARVPSVRFLERLHTRNNYLVDSHHPLRETIMNQTGNAEPERRSFLQLVDQFAIDKLIWRWEPKE